MEGVICNFKENEQSKIKYFFIEGEDGNQYFCHPSNMDSAFFDLASNQWPLWNSFLYDKWRYETHWEEENDIFILSFDPNEGPKGFFATNVQPSNKRINNEAEPFRIQITDLVWDHFAVNYYGPHPNYGAIARSYNSDVYMYYKKINGYGKGQVDIKPYILNENGRSKISDELVKMVKEKIIGISIEVKRVHTTPRMSNEVRDVVFYGKRAVHSIEQLLRNETKRDKKIENFSFDTSILKINM